MYKSNHYNEVREEDMIAFMNQHAFALITGAGEKFPVATQLPLQVSKKDGKIILSGHMMRGTDHFRAFEKNTNVLAVFTGPHAFVSAAWYKNPSVGSTINYQTVQAAGKIIFTDDEGTFKMLKEVTDRYTGTGNAASYENIPEEYKQRLVKAIAGFNIDVEKLDAVFKLSQEKDTDDRLNIIDELKNRNRNDDATVAAIMEKNIKC